MSARNYFNSKRDKLGNYQITHPYTVFIKKDNLKLISWIASFFSLLGTVLNAFLIIYCWPIWIVGNILWIYWSFKKKEWSQFILWIVFEVANVLGWYQWFIR